MANKDFVVKNGLIVGDTLTVSGVQIDLSNATSGQVLKFDGTKFEPAQEIDISGTVYVATVGDGAETQIVVNHNLGTRNVFVTIRSSTSPYEVINVRWEATSINSITLDFNAPPSEGSITVIVYAAVTGTQVVSHKETIGDGENDTFVITHNLNTRDIIVSIRNQSSPYENINSRWEATTANTATVYFSTAPSNSSVRIGILAI